MTFPLRTIQEFGGLVHINLSRCIGCSVCCKVCPTKQVIEIGPDRRAYVARPDLCAGCWSCLPACPRNALFVVKG